jgi:hypothetical protein
MALTKVTYDMIRGAPVNVADFIPQGVTSGYEPYIEAALQYCVDNEKDLYIDKIYPITTPMLLSRPIVDPSGQPWDKYSYTIMTIFSNGGGFSVDTNITGIFYCTAQYLGQPNRPTTENIRFLNVKFICDDATRNAWVIKGGTQTTPTFLRTTFEHCQFEKIKLVQDTYGSYLQSWYLINCLATLWQGNFMKADRSFDIQIISGRYEGTVNGNCFYLTNSYASKIWTQMESISGIGIIANAANGLDICCYFEANGRDIDTLTALNPQLAADLGTFFTSGINVHGCLFSQSLAFGQPSVTWNVNSRACISQGNIGFSNGTGIVHYIDFNIDNFQTGNIVTIDDVHYGTGKLSNFDAYANSGIRGSDVAPTGFNVGVSNSTQFTMGNTSFGYQKSGKMVNIVIKTTLTATTTTTLGALIIENFGYAPTGTAQEFLAGHVLIDSTEYPLITTASGQIVTLSNTAVPSKTVGQTIVVRALISYITGFA